MSKPLPDLTASELMETKGKTLQLDIIKRFMNDEQFNEFVNAYKANRRSMRVANRAEILEKKIPADEMEVLRVYLRDTETPIAVLERELNLRPGMLVQRAGKIALKCLYQNKKKISAL